LTTALSDGAFVPDKRPTIDAITSALAAYHSTRLASCLALLGILAFEGSGGFMLSHLARFTSDRTARDSFANSAAFASSHCRYYVSCASLASLQ